MSTEKSKNQFPRGSEWRKWDLHVHTPFSIEQNYGGESKFDKFIAELERLPQEVKVLGINDYYFIDGYEKVIEQKLTNNRLKNLEKIFPVLEFRIDTFGSGNENKLQKVNLHILFNIDESNYKNEIKSIKEEFLSQILIKNGENEKNLGQGKQSFIDLSDTKNLQDGFSNIIPSTVQVLGELAKDKWKNKVFLFLGYKEWNNLEKNNQIKPIKEALANKVQAFFTAISDKYADKQEIINKFVSNAPLLHSQDIHDFNTLQNHNCETWIKADPTFEGLKQIIFEPEERVKIQPSIPNDKSGYYIIDRIEIDCEDIQNKEILFNENLNTIIGGRSTGKSILLAAIANKLKLETLPNYEKKEGYKKYIEEISKSIKVFWKDGLEENGREVEFFQQGYMYELSNDKNKLNGVIEDILKKKGKEYSLENYKESINSKSDLINLKIDDLFKILEYINISKQKLLDMGDEAGIQKEIEKIENESKKILQIKVNDQEKIKYDTLKNELENLRNNGTKNGNDLKKLKLLIGEEIIKNDIESKLFGFENGNIKNNISDIFVKLRTEFIYKWGEELEKIQAKIQANSIQNTNRESEILKDPTFLKIQEAYNSSKQIQEIQERLTIEKSKLQQVKKARYSLNEFEKRKNDLVEDINKEFESFKNKTESIASELSENIDGLEIKAEIEAMNDEYKNILENALHNNKTENRTHLNNSIDSIYNVFNDLVEEKLQLKVGYTNANLAKILLTKNFYKINYNLVYENDTFSQMSDGKKSFVVLKLLLDFSDKKCPILIDQPEDDLDNRSIFQELVKYLKKKKTERQIIVATHNSNVVVSADAEEVIVANQNGKGVKNTDDKKFQYVSGSLENTYRTESELILESQGIQEHVCDILEGGKIAFENRKKKYNFN